MAKELRDYNGHGRWSVEGVLKRYAEHARRFHVAAPADLTPATNENDTTRWVYPVMHRVIEAIEQGDPAAIEIGVEFIHEDANFPLGRTLKSNTARALRKAPLSAEQAGAIRNRVLKMLVAGNVPHEFKEYARLLRRVGLGAQWPDVAKQVDRNNPYVMRYVNYLEQSADS